MKVAELDDDYVCDTTLTYDLRRTAFVKNYVITHYLDDYKTGTEEGKPLPEIYRGGT